MTDESRAQKRDDRRPLRDGVDGDDVWPVLSATELEAIASVDGRLGERERNSSWKAGVMDRLQARMGSVAV